MKKDLFNFQIQDFERYTNDQQFVNVVEPLSKIETMQGGLPPEEIWSYAINLLDSLKKVPRPEITVKRMFTLIVNTLKEHYKEREINQLEHTAYCILFCVVYILCSNDEVPDPNQEIIESICEVLSSMPDIVPLFKAVEKMEDDQDAKGYIVEPRNVLARPHKETADEATKRIMGILKQDIISPIVNADYVQSAYKEGFVSIWEGILANNSLLEIMRKEEFGKTYNLKMVVNILALMTYNRKVIKKSNNKIAELLFINEPKHSKYFCTETGSTYSAFKSSSEITIVNSIIDKYKK